jgi:hypothetical protein
MDAPTTIDGNAIGILTEGRYVWSDLVVGFQRRRVIGLESLDEFLQIPHIVSFEELMDHNLVDGSVGEEQAMPSERHEGLKWLSALIKQYSIPDQVLSVAN